MGILNKAQAVAGGSAGDVVKLKRMLDADEELIDYMQVEDVKLLREYDMVLGLTNKRVIVADGGLVFKTELSIPLNEVKIDTKGVVRRALIVINGRTFKIGIAAQGRNFCDKVEDAKRKYC